MKDILQVKVNDIFLKAPGRLIVATFSSNISRIQQICECALLHNRKIAIVGRSMENAVAIARDYGYIKVPDSTIIDASSIKYYENSEIVVLCTGSQGEEMAALSRIAQGDHRDIKIIPGDTVIFSSSAIPGNGVSIDNVVNQLTKCGADVITNSILSDIHSSGHPAKQELRLMLKLLKPKYFMPVHGEYRMLTIHGEIARSVGLKKENIFVLENGQSVSLVKHKCEIGYQIPWGVTFIDGSDINGLPRSVIEDRRLLNEDGMVAIVMGLNPKTNVMIHSPHIATRGFVFDKHVKLISDIEKEIEKNILMLLHGKTSYAELKTTMKNVAQQMIYKETNRQPMIIPLIISTL